MSGADNQNGKPDWGGWGGWGWKNNNSNPSNKVAQEPERRFGEIKITKAPPVPSSKLMAPPPKRISAFLAPPPTSAKIGTNKSAAPSTTLTPPSITPVAALGSKVDASKAQSPPKAEQSTSTTSSTQQYQATNSKSSYFAPPKSPSSKSNSSSRRRKNRSVDKEEEFLLEMREKRKSSEEQDGDGEDPFVMYEDYILERQANLSDDEKYALELLDRRRKFGSDNLTAEETEDLDLMIQDRKEAVKEEEELAELLDRKWGTSR
jgi:hypothetical protein